MSEEFAVPSRCDGEAAAWFTRLNTNKVSNADLNAFFDWRREPQNAAAYARVEKVRGLLEQLRDDPQIQAIAEDALRRGQMRRSLRTFLANLAQSPKKLAWGGACVAATIALIVATPALLGWRTFQTDVGERRVLRLADGSTVSLNTASKVSVRLGHKKRDVRLEQGEAFFEVAHDAARPFVVEASDTRVKALGTRFDVRKAASSVQVVLTQGRVEVSNPKGDPRVLAPGQVVTVPRAVTDHLPMPKPADVQAATSWTSGEVILKDRPLSDAVAEINRYSRQKVVLGDGAPADLRVNGVFESGDTQGFVLAMTKLLDLQSRSRWNGDIVLSAGVSGPS